MNIKRFAKPLVMAAVTTTLAAPTGMAWAQNRPVTTFQYDANGNMTSTTDALGRVTAQTYDALNRLKDVTQPKPVGTAPNPVTRFGVDGLDQLTSVTDARSLVTSYTVTGLGNLTQQVSPDTGTTLNTFDAIGNLKTSTDARGKKTTYYYDSIHRLTRALYGDGTNSYFYYDENANGVGRLTRMVDPGVTTRWTYTAQGRVASRSQALSAGGTTRTHTVLYGYNDSTGQLTSMTYPSGRVVAFQYGAASKQVETVTVDGTPVASSVTYQPFGGIKTMRLHNGLAWASTLDQDGRMTSYTLGGVVYSIAWDSANRITAITHATTPYWSRGYAYDGLDRIASFVSEPRDQIFSYDAVGNLLTKTDRVGTNDPVGYTYNISPTSNRMTGIGSMGIGYAVDAAGNRTADSTTTWVVNARGRVSQVRVISGATTYTYNYLINGQNLRVRKTGPSSVVPQGTQVFVYDEAGRLIGEYDNYGRARNEHVWLADRPVALIVYTYSGTSTTPLTTTYYSVEADHLGTPRLITDSTQAQRWSWHSAPYGDTQPNQNPASKGTLVYNLRFAGQYYDKETNNFYNWNRDYESTTGRYIQSDPIGLSGGINTYGYVNGNPLLSIDPTGEVPIAPIVYGYAKCMAQCMAFDAASEWLTGGSVQCLDAGELAKSCALDCVNPMNWFGGNKLKAAKAGGRHGGEAHRATVSRRATELQDQGHAVTAGGGLLPERSVITPEGKRRFPDISTIDPSGRPYHENVGRSISSGDPVARERRALDDIERSTGRRPGYTPYDRP